MWMERILNTLRTDDGYQLQINCRTSFTEELLLTWPVILKHSPEEIEQYISDEGLGYKLAQSVRKWCYSGFSYRENGFYLERESGSGLTYVDAYRRAKDEDKFLTPIDFYLISIRRRPRPAFLRPSAFSIKRYLSDMGATSDEEALVWEWVYEGNSVYSNPCGIEGLDFISWIRRDGEDEQNNYIRWVDFTLKTKYPFNGNALDELLPF